MPRLLRLADSYRLRLIVGYLLVAVIFSAAWVWSLYGPLTQAVLRQQQGNLLAVAQAGALVVGRTDQPAAQVAEQLVARTDLRLTIVAADGRVVTDSQFDPDTMENHRTRPEIAKALQGQTGIERRFSETEREEALYVAVPASLEGQRVALRVSQPLSEIEAIAASSRRFGLLLLLVASALASAAAWWAARAAAEPVARLSLAATRMAAGDLAGDVPDVPADLEPLGRALSSLRTQMRARLEALESEKRTLASTLDGLIDAVFVLDGRTITLANDTAGSLFRTPHGGWRGVDIADAGLPAPVAAAVLARMERTAGDATELEPDPTGRTFRLRVSPLDAAEPGRRTVVVVADVTERARLDRVRRDFVSNASHELKTPTAGIRLLAQAVETAAQDGDVDQALAFARSIESETVRLQQLVGDLLDLSRLEATPAADAIAEVRSAVDRAVLSHRSAAERRALGLVQDTAAVDGLDVYVRADPTDLAIALDNLLDNAIAYTAQGSVTVSVGIEGSDVAVSVRDTGVGIDAEHLPRIFERFYRVDGGRTREAGGTGLGLALVRHVVERSGGTVVVESDPGAGSTFTLRFPLAS